MALATQARLSLLSVDAVADSSASGELDEQGGGGAPATSGTPRSIGYGSELVLTVSPQIEVDRSRGLTHLRLEYSSDVANRMPAGRLGEPRAVLVMHGLGVSAYHGRAERTLWSADSRVDYGAEDIMTAVRTFNPDGRPLSSTAETTELRYFRATGNAGVERRVARRLYLGFSFSGGTLLPLDAADGELGAGSEAAGVGHETGSGNGADEPLEDGTLSVPAEQGSARPTLYRHGHLAADVFVGAVRPDIRLTVRPSLDTYDGVPSYWGITTMLEAWLQMGVRSRWTLQAGALSVWRGTSERPGGEARHVPLARALLETVLWRRADRHLDLGVGLGISPYSDPMSPALVSRWDARVGLLWQLTRHTGVTLEGQCVSVMARYSETDEARWGTRADERLLSGRLVANHVLSNVFSVEAGLEGIGRWTGETLPATWWQAWPLVYGVVALRARTEVL